MNGPANPVRQLWMVPSFFTSTTGQAVDLSPFVGPVTAMVIAKTGVGAARTITFETTTEDPASIGSPLSSGWANAKTGGFCDAETNLSVVVDPEAEPYATDDKIIKTVTLRDKAHFVRPMLSGADAAIVGVVFIGNAKELAEV